MGLTITAKNEEMSFDMSASGFFRLRYNIALAYDKEFAKQYEQILYCHTPEDYKQFNDKVNKILSDDRFSDDDEDLLNFFFMSDCNGKISYKTCRKIYELIKDIDFTGKTIVYSAYSDGKDYEHFKKFLKNCYSHRKNMIWY